MATSSHESQDAIATILLFTCFCTALAVLFFHCASYFRNHESFQKQRQRLRTERLVSHEGASRLENGSETEARNDAGLNDYVFENDSYLPENLVYEQENSLNLPTYDQLEID